MSTITSSEIQSLDPGVEAFSIHLCLIQEMVAMDGDNAAWACLIRMAERELGAFMSAVTELYGPQQSRIAAEDWIDAFESTNKQFGFTISEWRKLTIIAASRLATRLFESGVTPLVTSDAIGNANRKKRNPL